ncbi:MAG: DUF2252 family protein [Pseudomonadota bacterium]
MSRRISGLRTSTARLTPPTRRESSWATTHDHLTPDKVASDRMDRGPTRTRSTSPKTRVPTRHPGESRQDFVLRALRESQRTVSRLDPQAAATKLDRLEQSPFVFFRGTAFLFYADLAKSERHRPAVLCNGDVHPLNFGTMPGRDGKPVFGLNDFDEAAVAPFSFDVKRGATGFQLLAAEKGLSPAERGKVVRAFVDGYLDMLEKADGSDREHKAQTEKRTKGPVKELLERAADASRTKFLKGEVAHGRFVEDPELLPCRERIPEFERAVQLYVESLPEDRRPADGFLKIKDVVQKQGSGTGSLGAERYYVLVEGPGKKGKDDRILELKQSLPSVLEPYSGMDAMSLRAGGARVASAHHVQVVHGDPLYGHTTLDRRSFMVRERSPEWQRFDVEDGDSASLRQYARSCGEALALSHARCADHAEDRILDSLEPDRFTDEVVVQARELANKVVDDHARFVQLRRDGVFDPD